MKSLIKTGALLMGSLLLLMPVRAQWSGEASEPIQISEKYIWDDDWTIDADGNVYFYYLSPDNMRIIPYVKKVNYDGTMGWNDPIRLSAYPTLTFTMVNDYVTMDRDGNLVAIVWDERLDSVNRNYTATAYKIAPDGKMLWGEEGVNLCDGESLRSGLCMKLITLEDNSTVFVYSGSLRKEDKLREGIFMQRVSADGEVLWAGRELTVSGNYPFLVNAGNNEFYMVYCTGSKPEVYVQKYDFDGNAVWARPTLVYGEGGSGTGGAMHTVLSVGPAKDGLLVGWYDDRNETYAESVYLAYIDRNGKHVFSPGDAGLKLGYSDNRQLYIQCVYNGDDDAIYAIWREMDDAQTSQQLKGQKISAAGELMWRPEGMEICWMEERQAGQGSVQACKGGGAAFFYMTQSPYDYNHTKAYAVLYSSEGDLLWSTALLDGKHAASDLKSMPLRKNQWVVKIRDGRNYEGQGGAFDNFDIFAQNILTDGTLGSDAHLLANEHGVNAITSFGVSPNPVRESLNVQIETGRPAALRLMLCNLVGMEVATLYEGRVEGSEMLYLTRPAGLKSGLYIVKAVLDGKESSVKVVLH
ncbi:MAG: hypothetical protein K2L03_00655 [Bacteroidales bacterium]|nr:hypothetical protein [Bacteroidales bacterium]